MAHIAMVLWVVRVLTIGSGLYVIMMRIRRSRYQIGGIYSTKDTSGTFSVVKILAVDPFAVHLRCYNERWQSRPEAVDVDTLTFGFSKSDIEDPDKLKFKLAAGFGIGHMPISWAGFIKSEPQLITLTKISSDELEGYNYYRSRHVG